MQNDKQKGTSHEGAEREQPQGERRRDLRRRVDGTGDYQQSIHKGTELQRNSSSKIKIDTSSDRTSRQTQKPQYHYRDEDLIERRRARQREALRRRKRRQIFMLGTAAVAFLLVIGLFVILFGNKNEKEPVSLTSGQSNEEESGADNSAVDVPTVTKKTMVDSPSIEEQLLTINYYSRPGDELEEVNNIIIHYTGNPMTTAQNNRDYFEKIATTGESSVSSHYVIGMEGEIIQCVPLDEISYASYPRNFDTIAIEVCHEDSTGKFNDASYDSLIELCAWLVCKYDLTSEDLLRHGDVYPKDCPLYYIQNEDAWTQLKDDVAAYIEKNGSVVEVDENGNVEGETENTSQSDTASITDPDQTQSDN